MNVMLLTGEFSKQCFISIITLIIRELNLNIVIYVTVSMPERGGG